MASQYGFSFMEVLISLFVITTISLGLLNEQFLIKRRLNLMQQQQRECLHKENQAEADLYYIPPGRH